MALLMILDPFHLWAEDIMTTVSNPRSASVLSAVSQKVSNFTGIKANSVLNTWVWRIRNRKGKPQLLLVPEVTANTTCIGRTLSCTTEKEP